MLSTFQEKPYYKNLDLLRGIAVLLVVFFHFPIKKFQLQFGWVGVNLFFILSGYLITSGLIRSRNRPFRSYFMNYFMRRILRIFPLYFLYILVIVFFFQIISWFEIQSDYFVQQAKNDWLTNKLYLITYTYNFQALINYFTHKEYTSSYFFGHLWSLSVEEQFYLLLPFLTFFKSRPFLKSTFIILIILVPFLRVLFVCYCGKIIDDRFWIGQILYSNTVFQLDTFALGSLIAICSLNHIYKHKLGYLAFSTFSILFIGIWHTRLLNRFAIQQESLTLGFDIPVVELLIISPSEFFNYRFFYMIPAVNILFGLSIICAIGMKECSNVFVRAISFIGKLSYGIYIYHLAYSLLFSKLVDFLHAKAIVSDCYLTSVILGFTYLIFLLLFSTVSFKLIEKRFLHLKIFFPH